MTDSVPAPAAATRRPGNRERLVTAAVQLLHQQGIERTTLADIAKAADVPPGNVYYYFKTRDELVRAVIAARAARLGLRDDLLHDAADVVDVEAGPVGGAVGGDRTEHLAGRSDAALARPAGALDPQRRRAPAASRAGTKTRDLRQPSARLSPASHAWPRPSRSRRTFLSILRRSLRWSEHLFFPILIYR